MLAPQVIPGSVPSTQAAKSADSQTDVLFGQDTYLHPGDLVAGAIERLGRIVNRVA